jgi:hypothetical protein
MLKNGIYTEGSSFLKNIFFRNENADLMASNRHFLCPKLLQRTLGKLLKFPNVESP